MCRLRVSTHGLEAWLRKRKAYNAGGLALLVTEAPRAQTIRVPGESVAGQVVDSMATEEPDLGRRLADLDDTIEAVFMSHTSAAILESMPGIGPLLGAEMVAATGEDVSIFGTADRFAAVAGPALSRRETRAGSVETSDARAGTTEGDTKSVASCVPVSPTEHTKLSRVEGLLRAKAGGG